MMGTDARDDMKKLLLGITALVIVVLLGAWYFTVKNAPEKKGDELISSTPASSAEITIDSPLPNAIVTSPLTVSGKAKGTWFFEANIPVVLKDGNGNIVAQVGGRAKSDWMTTDLVPFEATLDFTNPGTAYGTLEIRKDNPSGMAEHDASFSVPIRFDLASYQVKVFWGSSRLNPNETDCGATFPGQRTILATSTIAHAALDELLKGPEAGEKRIGYFTSIPENVTVQHLTIQDGVARVDFNTALNSVGGSCRVTAIRSQIVNTLMQFPTVSKVVISVDGNVDEALQP